MKKVILLFSIAFAIIASCMIYLVYTGVSLRLAPVISPSPIGENFANLVQGLTLRLSADFEGSHYLIWGASPETKESRNIRIQTQKTFEELTGEDIHWIDSLVQATPMEIANCKKPCWILAPQALANELSPNPLLDKKIRPLGREFATITLVGFQKEFEVSSACLEKKRLDFSCLEPVALNEMQKKLKRQQEASFFVRKYNQRDYFVFIENLAGF